MARYDISEDVPFRRGIMIGTLVIASLAMVGIFFSRPPVQSLLLISTGSVKSVISAGESLNFTLDGWAHPLHYSFMCGDADQVAAALVSAQRAGTPVRVQHRGAASQHKNLGLAYDAYAVSVPTLYDRTYAQCREHWIAYNQRQVLFAIGFLAGFLILVLATRVLRKR